MDAVKKGLAYLAGTQTADGSFKSFSSPSVQPFVTKTVYTTTFIQAVMLGALAQVPDKQALHIRSRLAVWLLKQHSRAWSFNYWPRNDPMTKRLPYPDDLDDTFCALLALRLHDPDLIGAACLGKVVKLLVATELQTGGPYRTWLVPRDSDPAWLDVDLAVNSNIAGFLQLAAGPLPKLTELMERAIEAGELSSPYYPSSYPVAYYLARAYKGPSRQRLAVWLLTHAEQGIWSTPLQTALAVSALVQLGQADRCARAIEFLTAAQTPDGAWPAEAFCLDPAQNGRSFYNGAPALTTALVLEALTRYQHAQAAVRESRSAIKAGSDATCELNDKIYALAKTELSTLTAPLNAICLKVAAATAKTDQHHEITLLPALFAAALKTSPARTTQDHLIALGKANLYGWMAYTIYDDFLDEEGDPMLLPTANIALRRCLVSFRQCLPGQRSFQQLVEQVFDVIDAANTWEVSNCRLAVAQGEITIGKLPRYGQRRRLAERSLGHLLTPLAILLAERRGLHRPEVKAIRRGLMHYIIARQLSDDLHDWEKDLQKGHSSYVVSQLLRDSRLGPGKHALAQLTPRLQHHFWHYSVRRLCATALSHTAAARQAFRSSGLLTENNSFLALLERLDGGVRNTLQEQDRAAAFLKSYTS